CFQNSEPLKLQHIGGQNWFGRKSIDSEAVLQMAAVQSMTFLDFFGGVQGADANVYVDDTWRGEKPDAKVYVHTMRFNEFLPQHVAVVRNSTGAERVYVVGDRTGAPAISTTSNHALSSKADGEYITPEDSPL